MNVASKQQAMITGGVESDLGATVDSVAMEGREGGALSSDMNGKE